MKKLDREEFNRALDAIRDAETEAVGAMYDAEKAIRRLYLVENLDTHAEEILAGLDAAGAAEVRQGTIRRSVDVVIAKEREVEALKDRIYGSLQASTPKRAHRAAAPAKTPAAKPKKGLPKKDKPAPAPDAASLA